MDHPVPVGAVRRADLLHNAVALAGRIVRVEQTGPDQQRVTCVREHRAAGQLLFRRGADGLQGAGMAGLGRDQAQQQILFVREQIIHQRGAGFHAAPA